MSVLVRAPATVANLGPAFDAMALAVDLWNEVEAHLEGEPSIETEGEGAAEIPSDPSNLILRAMDFFSRETGRRLPPFGLRSKNAIPLERGLGSSAAAVCGGVLLADALLETRLAPDHLLQLAVDVEGHPDNVAACLRGGIALAYLSQDGWRAEALDPSPDLLPVLLVPEHDRLATDDARRVLPQTVALGDAVFNLGRSALLVSALTRRPELLPSALEDRLHQNRRLPLVPASRAVFEDLRERGIPVCVAGAGPSLLAFESGRARVPELGPSWRLIRTSIPGTGAEVV